MRRFCNQFKINKNECGLICFFLFFGDLVIDYRSMTLMGLLDYIKDKFSIESTAARRLRNLETN